MAVGAVRSVRAVSVCPNLAPVLAAVYPCPLRGCVYITAFLAFFVAFLALSVAVWCNPLARDIIALYTPFLWIVKT